MHFTLRQIAVFDAIVRSGTLSAAAEELAMSQSAASMALKELEDHLGTRLFHRYGRRLVLNENGRRLRPKARALVMVASEITRPESEELEGLLRIATTATVGSYMLPRCSAEFLLRHPKVRIETIVGGVPETVERLEAISVDLGLIDTTCNRTTIQIELIGDDEVVVFASPEHPLARRRKVSIADLQASSWCLREAPSLSRLHLATALGEGRLRDVRFVASTHEAVKAAVIAGLGLGFASTHVIARELAAGELVLIPANSVTLRRRFTLLTPKDVYESRLPQAFTAHLRQWFAAAPAQ